MRKLFLLVSAMSLAACSATPAPEPTPAPAPVIAPAISEPVEETPVLLPIEYNRIEGATPAEVQGYLGEPSLVRRDGSVQVMIFEAPSCVFEVVFYEPANGDHFRADHLDARSRSGSETDMDTCLRTLLSTP